MAWQVTNYLTILAQFNDAYIRRKSPMSLAFPFSVPYTETGNNVYNLRLHDSFVAILFYFPSFDLKEDVYHFSSLHGCHNGHDSVSNHQPHDCLLLNRLSRRRSKKISKFRVTGLCAGNSPETGELPAQMNSNAENVSIWWRHHVSSICNTFHWQFLKRQSYETLCQLVCYALSETAFHVKVQLLCVGVYTYLKLYTGCIFGV